MKKLSTRTIVELVILAGIFVFFLTKCSSPGESVLDKKLAELRAEKATINAVHAKDSTTYTTTIQVLESSIAKLKSDVSKSTVEYITVYEAYQVDTQDTVSMVGAIEKGNVLIMEQATVIVEQDSAIVVHADYIEAQEETIEHQNELVDNSVEVIEEADKKLIKAKKKVRRNRRLGFAGLFAGIVASTIAVISK